MPSGPAPEDTDDRQQGAKQQRHWVRCVTACDNHCLFCLDADTPRGLVIPTEDLKQEIDRGIDTLGATRLVLSGGEPTLHPEFIELVAHGKHRGYQSVQCITNGSGFASREFMAQALDAGLDEITFSLHGHTAALHDRLTQNPGSFNRLIKGLGRALRHPRVIVSVDVCLNRLNIAHLEQIVELGISLGVTEFDLLQIIPQAAAFEHREQLFYDVEEHLPVLQRVLRLGEHPRYHIWTNRLPARYLEGHERAIQSPLKLLDEVNGRRRHLQAYLDSGTPLECRSPDRCVHCFIEPFCTALDRFVGRVHAGAWQVWWIAEEPMSSQTVPDPLPFGCDFLGMHLQTLRKLDEASLPAGAGLYLQLQEPAPLTVPTLSSRPLVLLVDRPQQLDAWLPEGGVLGPTVELDIELNRSTAPWLLAHRPRVASHRHAIRLHAPPLASLQQTRLLVLRNTAGFFRELQLAVRTSGWPACLAPHTVLSEPIWRLDRRLFDPATGRIDPHQAALHHVAWTYRVKSQRCERCPVTQRCEGAHINLIRHLGFAVLTPLRKDRDPGWLDLALGQLGRRWPRPPVGIAQGRPPEPPCLGPSGVSRK